MPLVKGRVSYPQQLGGVLRVVTVFYQLLHIAGSAEEDFSNLALYGHQVLRTLLVTVGVGQRSLALEEEEGTNRRNRCSRSLLTQTRLNMHRNLYTHSPVTPSHSPISSLEQKSPPNPC